MTTATIAEVTFDRKYRPLFRVAVTGGRDAAGTAVRECRADGALARAASRHFGQSPT
ncbi:hypothetical protein [Actinomadura hibisca]|uniref:hypothetical protein n=1 Tax=Actinomadura hibisca TaxID=68565 RepID=UPI001FE073F1|nr:hypothetical protein [Actinomadura hibisca]